MALRLTPYQAPDLSTNYGNVGALTANIGESFLAGLEQARKQRQAEDRQRQLALLQGQVASGDYRGAAGGAIGLGDIKGAASFLELGQAATKAANEAEAQRSFSRLIGLPGSSPSPGPGVVPGTESLIRNESGGNFRARNDAVGSGGMVGHFGRAQFGQARLNDAMRAGVIPSGTTPEQFMASPELQQRAERWHFANIDQDIKRRGYDKLVGQQIGGVPVTIDGLRAVAHLGGVDGMRRFVETGGRYNPADANGTRLSDYFSRHGGAGNARVADAQGQSSGESGMPPGDLFPSVDSGRIAALAAAPGVTDAQRQLLRDTLTNRRAWAQSQANKETPKPDVREFGGKMWAVDPRAGTAREISTGADTGYRSVTDPDERRALGIPASDQRLYQINKATGRIEPAGNAPIENEQLKAEQKRFAERSKTIADEANAARQSLGTIEIMNNIMKSPQFYSGFGGNIALQANRALSAIGIKDSTAASPAEVFQSLGNKLVLDAIGGSLGTAVSNTDRDFIVATQPNLSNTPAGNAALLVIAKRLAERRIEVARMARQYRARNGGLLDDRFDDELRQFGEDNPIVTPDLIRQIERPAARQTPAMRPGDVQRFDGATMRRIN